MRLETRTCTVMGLRVSLLHLFTRLSLVGQPSDYVKHPITSRAHLLDIAGYLKRHNRPELSYFDNSTPISLDLLEACSKEQGNEFRQGDILLVRTGWTEAFYALSEAQRQHLRSRKGSCGVSQASEVLEWHWENGIVAVASDT